MRVCPYSFYLALCLLAAGLWPAPAGAAQDLQGVFADLRDDIQSAQRALAAEQYQIELSMAALAKKIDIEGAGLRDLRQRVEVVRRTADESALSLETLQGRLQEWRAQDAYHRNLLRDFAERQGVAIGSSGHHGAVASALARLEQSLQPAFGPATVSRPQTRCQKQRWCLKTKRTQTCAALSAAKRDDLSSIQPLTGCWSRGLVTRP